MANENQPNATTEKLNSVAQPTINVPQIVPPAAPAIVPPARPVVPAGSAARVQRPVPRALEYGQPRNVRRYRGGWRERDARFKILASFVSYAATLELRRIDARTRARVHRHGRGGQGRGSPGQGGKGRGSPGQGGQGRGGQERGSPGQGVQGRDGQGLGSQGLGSQGLGSQGLGSQGLDGQGLGSQGQGGQGEGGQGQGG